VNVKIIVQRVKKASVSVGGTVVSEIRQGLLLFVGIGKRDDDAVSAETALKISKFRIFEDDLGKMNLDISQVSGEVLSVSQFTLLADTESGNRPGFDAAAPPDQAKKVWCEFNESLRKLGIKVSEGVFGANMQVELVNDGPVTFIVSSR